MQLSSFAIHILTKEKTVHRFLKLIYHLNLIQEDIIHAIREKMADDMIVK